MSKDRWPKRNQNSGVEDVALLILEWLGEQGVDSMIRIDAERVAARRPPRTFTAHGGPLPRGLHADGSTAGECLDRALSQLRDAGLTVPF